MALTAKVRNVEGVAVVDLSGRITLGDSTGILRDEVRSLVAQGRKNIVLNLADVGYVDSSGLGELVGAYATAANHGSSLRLVHLQSKMHALMQITKLYTVFSVFSDEGAAVASFGSPVSLVV